MANDLEKMIETLPGWVIPATVGAVVLVSLFSQKSSGGNRGATVVYGPAPIDPGLVSMAERETSARESVLNTALNAFISRDISGINADRDVALGHISESIANTRTHASEAVGLAQTDAAVRIGLENARTTRYVTDSEGATAKYVARKGAQQSIWHSFVQGVSSVAALFA